MNEPKNEKVYEVLTKPLRQIGFRVFVRQNGSGYGQSLTDFEKKVCVEVHTATGEYEVQIQVRDPKVFKNGIGLWIDGTALNMVKQDY